MISSRPGPKALGLCATIVGMSIFASVAHAEPNAFWLVNGVKISSVLLPTVEAKTDIKATLLTEIAGKFIHITCATVKTVGAHLVEPLAQVLGKLRFHGCKFFELVTPGGPLKEISACTPLAEGSKGLIVTNTITGLIKLHESKVGFKEAVLESKPTVAGLPFTLIHLGEECAYGEHITVEGVFFLKDSNGLFTNNAVEHLLEELKALTSLSVNGGIKTGTIDGSAWAFLGGTHAGLTFSGQPG